MEENSIANKKVHIGIIVSVIALGYPSISGTHYGTLTPNQTITVNTLYTYPCAGTGGHTEYAKIWSDTWTGEEAFWDGYQGNWHSIAFNEPSRYSQIKNTTMK